ncbi:hypothetical protein ACIP2X_25520 [Streptomyces sp. NPDC089424]|uniref:hypothetical protein n=1 Tax=Streptomyces sp. NPDC089424 TaxID=3365917 RepID=UPI00380A7AB2
MSDVTRPMGGGEPQEPDGGVRRDTTPGTARDASGGASLRAGAVAPGGEGAREAHEAAGAAQEARRAHDARATAAEAPARPPADPAAPTSRLAPLLPGEESAKFELRLQQAMASFVDGPRAAIEEADHVLEEIAARFTEAVTQRRRTLRRSWESSDEATPATSDTEQLRLALRDYRELAERLLRH